MIYLLIFLPLVFATGVGFANYTKLPLYLKIILFQVLLALIVESIGAATTSNEMMFNYYLLYEGVLIICSASMLTKIKIWGGLVQWLPMIYAIAWLTIMLLNDSEGFYYEIVLVESIIVLPLFLIAFYSQILSTNGRLFSQPFFWICLGHIIFYGCNIPFFSFWNLLLRNDMILMGKLYNIIRVLSFIRYSFIALAVLLLIRQQIMSTTNETKPVYYH